ncbi:MAG: DUF3667 domain-containing protein [Chitinophagaceae bacterium]
MHSSDHCLNCQSPAGQAYCPVCGQKTDTHRITVKHFVLHDLLHGVWHLEKGIWFTLKETLFRPGYAAVNYIEGRRVRYYNIFYLTLLVLGFILLLSHWQHKLYPAQGDIIQFEGDGTVLKHFFETWSKPLIFSFVPFTAACAWIVFRRLRYNFAEHNIIGGFCLLAITLYIAVDNIVSLLPPDGKISGLVIDWSTEIITILILLQPLICYRQVARKKYTTGGFIWRILLLYLLMLFAFIVLVFVCMAIVSKGNFDGRFEL